MTTAHRASRARGVSLIELMIALAIGALLVLGLVEVFAASRTAYQLSEGLARVQENSRFAIDYLQRDLRMVGHMGCVNDQSRFLPENDSGSRSALASTFLLPADLLANNYSAVLPAFGALRFDRGIEGFEANNTGEGDTLTSVSTPALEASGAAWSPAITGTLLTDLTGGAAAGRVVQKTDVLVLRYFAPVGAQLVSFTPGDPTATITFDASKWPQLTEGEANPGLFAISDCMNAAVFRASTASAGTITVTKDTVNRGAMAGYESYVPGQANVYRAMTVVYYVGRNADGNPALYRMRYSMTPGATALTSTREELVEGVESLQLRYGQDSRLLTADRPTGNIGNSFTADDVAANAASPGTNLDTAWRRVGLVQVGLVVRSDNPSAAPDRVAAQLPLSLHGLTILPPTTGDTRYRTVYEESIALRNRLFGN